MCLDAVAGWRANHGGGSFLTPGMSRAAIHDAAMCKCGTKNDSCEDSQIAQSRRLSSFLYL